MSKEEPDGKTTLGLRHTLDGGIDDEQGIGDEQSQMDDNRKQQIQQKQDYLKKKVGEQEIHLNIQLGRDQDLQVSQLIDTQQDQHGDQQLEHLIEGNQIEEKAASKIGNMREMKKQTMARMRNSIKETLFKGISKKVNPEGLADSEQNAADAKGLNLSNQIEVNKSKSDNDKTSESGNRETRGSMNLRQSSQKIREEPTSLHQHRYNSLWNAIVNDRDQQPQSQQDAQQGSNNTKNIDDPSIINQTRIFEENYEILGEKLGEGCHGDVRKCIHKKTQKIYAVKMIRNGDTEIILMAISSFKIAKNLNHPSIIKPKELFINRETEKIYYVMEFCEFKSLQEYVETQWDQETNQEEEQQQHAEGEPSIEFFQEEDENENEEDYCNDKEYEDEGREAEGEEEEEESESDCGNNQKEDNQYLRITPKKDLNTKSGSSDVIIKKLYKELHQDCNSPQNNSTSQKHHYAHKNYQHQHHGHHYLHSNVTSSNSGNKYSSSHKHKKKSMRFAEKEDHHYYHNNLRTKKHDKEEGWETQIDIVGDNTNSKELSEIDDRFADENNYFPKSLSESPRKKKLDQLGCIRSQSSTTTNNNSTKSSNIAKPRVVPYEIAKKILREILLAVSYLHSEGICHRDLKPDNILLSDDLQHVKIIDFEISKQFKYFRANRQVIKVCDMWTRTGTQDFMSPEMFESAGYTEAVDIWAIGVIAYLLLSGRLPFDQEYISDKVDFIRAGNYNTEYIRNIDDVPKDFIRRMLRKEPTERLTAVEALAHPWFLVDYEKDLKVRQDLMVHHKSKYINNANQYIGHNKQQHIINLNKSLLINHFHSPHQTENDLSDSQPVLFKANQSTILSQNNQNFNSFLYKSTHLSNSNQFRYRQQTTTNKQQQQQQQQQQQNQQSYRPSPQSMSSKVGRDQKTKGSFDCDNNPNTLPTDKLKYQETNYFLSHNENNQDIASALPYNPAESQTDIDLETVTMNDTRPLMLQASNSVDQAYHPHFKGLQHWQQQQQQQPFQQFSSHNQDNKEYDESDESDWVMNTKEGHNDNLFAFVEDAEQDRIAQQSKNEFKRKIMEFKQSMCWRATDMVSTNFIHINQKQKQHPQPSQLRLKLLQQIKENEQSKVVQQQQQQVQQQLQQQQQQQIQQQQQQQILSPTTICQQSSIDSYSNSNNPSSIPLNIPNGISYSPPTNIPMSPPVCLILNSLGSSANLGIAPSNNIMLGSSEESNSNIPPVDQITLNQQQKSQQQQQQQQQVYLLSSSSSNQNNNNAGMSASAKRSRSNTNDMAEHSDIDESNESRAKRLSEDFTSSCVVQVINHNNKQDNYALNNSLNQNNLNGIPITNTLNVIAGNNSNNNNNNFLVQSQQVGRVRKQSAFSNLKFKKHSRQNSSDQGNNQKLELDNGPLSLQENMHSQKTKDNKRNSKNSLISFFADRPLESKGSFEGEHHLSHDLGIFKHIDSEEGSDYSGNLHFRQANSNLSNSSKDNNANNVNNTHNNLNNSGLANSQSSL